MTGGLQHVLDQVRRTRRTLTARGRWGEADEVVREVVDFVLAAPLGPETPDLRGLVHVPGGTRPDDVVPRERRHAMDAVRLANRGVDRLGALAAARRVLSSPAWRDAGSFWHAVLTLCYAEEFAEARQQCERARAEPGWVVTSGHRDVLELLSARLAWFSGDPARAARAFDAAWERGVHDRLRELTIAWQAAALLDTGDLDRAQDLVLAHDFPGGDRIELLASRATLHFATGRLELAGDGFRACGRRLLGEWGVVNPAVLPWRSRAALCAHAMGRKGLAAALARQELAAARRWGGKRALGIARHAVAVVGGGDPEALRQAETALEKTGATGELLRVRHDLALTLGMARDYPQAKRILARTKRIAEDKGYGSWARRADAAMARFRRLDGEGGLTPSERKIAVLARAGKSNRDIAQREQVTLRTVEFHLSGVYRKLGIRGRRELRTIPFT